VAETQVELPERTHPVEHRDFKVWLHRHQRALIIVGVVLVLLLLPPLFLYVKYYRMVGDTLAKGAFSNATNILSAPEEIAPGDNVSPADVEKRLRRSGYSTDPSNRLGYYIVKPGAIEIHPGPQSYFSSEPALVKFNKDGVSELVSPDNKTRLERYGLEPILITNIVGGDREKRRPVRFSELPPVLVQAVTSAEDKRFFDHIGLDPLRLAKAAYVDAKAKRKEQGASTITMQLARGLWLDPDKNWKRKFNEIMITLVLEQRLSKQEIFETYANQVYLGRQDTFNVHGFGEAAHAYFNKEIGQVNLPEAALLAGLIQRPSYFNPFRYPDRAIARRNVVLELMHQNRYITAAQYAAAIKAPLSLAPPKPGEGEAPYFIALLNDELQARLPDDEEEGGLQVYSTLDPDLQRAATEAVRDNIPKIDKLVARRNKDGVRPQVALVALDPHTGEVKAVVGGRNYGESQLNHALSMRQPGSIFKPFVYAAALDTGAQGKSGAVFTEASTVNDSPATFTFANQVYEPSNFHDKFYGTVTLKKALAHSMNLATVSLAEKVGYDNVVNLAKRAGLNDKIQPTPAVALGAYEATPLEMAGAYTVFANNGTFVKPTFIRQVRTPDARVLVKGSPESHRVLDPRVTFLMRDMLEEVMRSGTAAGVRAQGFKVPAAGKTGTSRDGWFAGFTAGLLCIVWVGFDDNRELNLEGARSALPIWTDFMKKAVALRDVAKPFAAPPAGVVKVAVDPYSGLRAGPGCPGQPEYFIAGTEPKAVCTPEPPDPFEVASPVDMIRSTADRAVDGIGRVLKAPLKVFGHE
jgi:penicillin-binding protein 1B